jgi:hypothetical protein
MGLNLFSTSVTLFTEFTLTPGVSTIVPMALILKRQRPLALCIKTPTTLTLGFALM